MKFNPGTIFSGVGQTGAKLSLVILNQPICHRNFYTIWDNCVVRACADGGANRLYDELKTDELRKKYLPNFIAGDFDSLRSEVEQFYRANGVSLIHDPDQYATDFMKVTRLFDADHTIVALGGTGGRVDQSFHSIFHLFLSEKRSQLIYLVSAESVSFLVDNDKQNKFNEILTPREYFGETCGIIPIVGSSVISTQGLVWDVEDWETSFYTKISTNNKLDRDTVLLATDKPVLFTVEVRGTDN